MDINIKNPDRGATKGPGRITAEAVGLAICVMIPGVTAATFGMVIFGQYLGLI